MWQQPKTNWDTHPKAIEPADLNRIEGNILAVREQSDLPFKLEIVSALPSAAGNQGRAVFYNGRAYICDGTKWTDISGSIGDATAANVLSGKVFSSQSAGVGITGAMPNRGAHNITPGKTAITIPEGYHSGSGQVASLGGNAAAANVLTGKTFSSDVAGRAASGSMPNRTGHVTAQGSSVSGTTLRFRPQPGYYPGDAGNSVQLSDADFVPANIREGKSLFGVQGILRKEPLMLIGNLGRVVVPWVEGYTQGPGKVEQLYAPASYPIRISQGSTEPGDTRTWVTDNPIDLTHFSTLRIGWIPHSGALKACVVSTSKMGDHNVYDARYTISGDWNFRENEINIRSLSGEFYIRVHCVTVSGGNAWANIAYMTLHQD
jgi:hypothetical protein